MLISFTFGNYRSFRNEVTLTMESASITEHSESLIGYDGGMYLPVAVMYGANSSGKSNVIKALDTFKWMVLESNKNELDEKLEYDPFLFDTKSAKEPMVFEIVCVVENVKYRYGFESYKDCIKAEWLFEQLIGSDEQYLFEVEDNDVDVNPNLFSEANGFDNINLGNKLLLPLVAQQSKTAKKSTVFIDWLKSKFNSISGTSSKGYLGYSLRMFKDKIEGYKQALGFLNKLDLGFDDYKVVEWTPYEVQRAIEDIASHVIKSDDDSIKEKLEALQSLKNDVEEGNVVKAQTRHKVYGDNGEFQRKYFDDREMESEGSRKVISLTGPIFDTLNEGAVIIIDELDAKLHPFLTREIVKLFANKKTNPNGAQLIFATHDTNLLDLSLLRRDEIWFVEKDEKESSDLYSLVEFKTIDGQKVRKDASLERNYINGRYGAIPFIN